MRKDRTDPIPPGRGLGALAQVVGTLLVNHISFWGFTFPMAVALEAKRVFLDPPGTPSRLSYVEEDPDELGYTVVYRDLRAIDPVALAKHLGITESEARAVLERFRLLFPTWVEEEA